MAQRDGGTTGTMGTSTRRRLEALIHAVNASGSGKGAGSQQGGGAGGSYSGSWGKAATGRMERPLSAGAAAAGRPNKPAGGGVAAALMAAGQQAARRVTPPRALHKEHVKRNCAGASNLWDRLPQRPHSASPCTRRPKSPGATLQLRQSGPRDQEYRLTGAGLVPVSDRPGAVLVPLPAPAAAGLKSSAAGRYSLETQQTIRDLERTDTRTSSDAAMLPMTGTLGSQQQQQGGAGAAGAAAATASQELEDRIRDAVRAKRSVSEGSLALLARLFKQVDDGSGDVGVEEFCSLVAKLGIPASMAEAQGMFRRFGYDAVMPFQRWAAQLVNQPGRQLAEDMAVRKGPFRAGQSYSFCGKIIYEECRKPVYTPSDWDPALGERSAELPASRLALEFIYGYTGHNNGAQNLHYTGEGRAVYYTAGVGVVYERRPVHRQWFFLGHSDDIRSLAVCRAAVGHGGQQYEAGRVVATGQVSSHDEGPCICIWDSSPSAAAPGTPALPELARIQLGKQDRSVLALGFSPCGTKLAAVVGDNAHTVYVFDWRAGAELGSGRSCVGEPPQVCGIEWCPYELTHGSTSQFVTFGKKHIKLWQAGAAGAYMPTQLSFGKLPLQNVHSAAWLAPTGPHKQCQLLAGMDDGQIYVFKGTAAIRAISAHKPGPSAIQPDGHPAHAGLRGLRVCKGGGLLLSGGADGLVQQWEVADGDIRDGRLAGPPISIKPSNAAEKAPGIRALDWHEGSGALLVGDSNCGVWEVPAGGSPVMQMHSHSSDMHALAFHPAKPTVCATVCDGNQVFVWDLAQRDLLASAVVGFTARAVAISPQLAGGRHHLAVGGAKGHIKILDSETLQVVHECRDSQQGVSDLKFSPDGQLLAAATHDQTIEVYSVGERKYGRLARCSGHSATVKQVDWSSCSSVLQSACAAGELLYWNARSGKQINVPQRDTAFATWTCQLGFPVMGIWPPCTEATDVNAVDRSPDGALLVTADDRGLVKLFNCPCVVEDAPHRAYRGHSAHVMGARFSADGGLVCSVGGRDCAMFQFRVVPTA